MRLDPRGMAIAGLAGCGGSPDRVEVLAELPCADPAATVRFTTDFLEGDPAASHRFAGGGIGVGDLDGDGQLDLIAPGPTRLRVWRQTSSRAFTASMLPSEVSAFGDQATAVALGDVDRDGDLDVWVARFGPGDVLLLNDGMGGLTPVRDALVSPEHYGQGAAFVDLDRDGWLDVVVAGHAPVEEADGQVQVNEPADPTRVLRQRPPTPGAPPTFEDRTAGVASDAQVAYTFVATATELDGDGRPDLLLANDFPIYRPNLALRQTRTGTFALVPESGLHVPAAGMGVAVHDVNRDGWDDFVLPVWDRLVFLRSRDGSPPQWLEAQTMAGLTLPPADVARVGWGADFGDLDADGAVDLLVAFGHLDTVAPRAPSGGTTDNALLQPDQAYRGRPEGGFEAVDWGLAHEGPTRGLLTVDLDHDGALDVVRRDLDGPIRIDWGQCGSGHTLAVVLDPPADAVGATLWVTADGVVHRRGIRAGGESLASARPPEVHFGLGEATEVRDLTVQWPDGTTEVFPGRFSADRRLRIRRSP